MRSRLDQLRGLMQYYQSGGDEASGATAAPQPQDLSLPAVSDYEDPQLMQNLRLVTTPAYCFSLNRTAQPLDN